MPVDDNWFSYFRKQLLQVRSTCMYAASWSLIFLLFAAAAAGRAAAFGSYFLQMYKLLHPIAELIIAVDLGRRK
jgi:hypothetical protein